MANINLAIEFNHPDAIAHQVSYARIDNLLPGQQPSFSNVSPNPTTSPAVLATNVPNGQYQINSIPVYPDGRICEATTVYTPACPPLLSLNAVIQGSSIVVNYLAPPSVPNVLITVNYPNGGSFSNIYVNNGNSVSIAIPPGVTGTFTVFGQSVCDATSGFYSAPTPQASVTYQPNNLTITSDAANITITTLTGIAGFTLPQNVTVGSTIVGVHQAFFNSISFTWTGMPALQLNVSVQINGVTVQCVDIPNTTGGSLTIPSVSVGANDQLQISFNTGDCP